MKKLVVAVAVGMVCLGAMAQGKVAFATSTSKLVYWGATGQGVTAADNIKVDLFVGKTSDSLSYAATQTAWQATPGAFTTLNVILPAGFTGGPATGATSSDAFNYYFQVQAYSGLFASAAAAQAAGGAFGYSDIFTSRASSTAAYFSLASTASPSFSTWAAGTTPVLPGGFGAIALIVPEPSSFALAGLGAAALLIFRRRN